MKTIHVFTTLGLLLGLSIISPVQAQKTLADVVIVVDSSASMGEEAAALQSGLPSFAQLIASQFIDLRVILIAGNSICVPSPLGSGNCPLDDNLPGYRHVVETVGSSDALQKILNTYGQWSGLLRPNASKTIIVVSDDDSALSAPVFDAALIGLDPGFAGYRFHGIVADFVSPFDPCQQLASGPGTEYIQLISQTGGLLNDLCDQQVSTGLETFAQAVVEDTGIGTPDPPVPDNCEIELNQTSYVNGETVTANVFRLANPGPDPVIFDLRNWIVVSPDIALSVVDLDELVMPTGFDVDLGPIPLFTVTAEFPRGLWEFNCRFLDPISGAERFLDRNVFQVQ